MLGAALILCTFVVAHRMFTGYATQAARADIDAVRGTLTQLVQKSLDSYRIQARVVSEDSTLKEALVKGSAELAYTVVDSAQDRTQAEYVALIGGDDRVLAHVAEPEAAGSGLPVQAPPAGAKDGEAAGFLPLPGKLVAAAIVPVKLQGRSIGWLMIGDALSPEMLADVRKIADAHITILTSKGTRISTFGDAEAEEVSRAAGGCDPAKIGAVDRVEIGGAPYLYAIEPLRDIRGEPLGCIAVTRSIEGHLEELRQMQRWLVLLGLLITALAVAGGWLVSYRMVKPIERLTQTALRIAAGDLSQGELPHAGKDEVGQMAAAFNQMLHSLRTLAEAADRMARKDLRGRIELEGQVADAYNRMIVGQRGVVREIGGAAVELTTAAAKIYGAAQQQEAAAAQKATAVEDVSRTMQSLLESASHIADSARGVLANAERTKDTTEVMGKRLGELWGHTSRISELLEVIRDIADRSDLIALNASLEATRAGESGRAFALLAGEMRRLAERVTAQVADVKSLLADVRVSGSATMDAMKEGRKLAEGTTESARQITLVTQQQRSATEQVLEGMRHISSVLGDSVAAAHETRASAGALKQQADKLSEVVGEFALETADPP
jgi:methyl-accepting chemotaxis protein